MGVLQLALPLEPKLALPPELQLVLKPALPPEHQLVAQELARLFHLQAVPEEILDLTLEAATPQLIPTTQSSMSILPLLSLLDFFSCLSYFSPCNNIPNKVVF